MAHRPNGEYVVTMKILVSKTLRRAEQPVLATTKRGLEYRTPGYWVELIRDEEGKYVVEWGDERGGLGSSRPYDDEYDAESFYERKLDYFDIVEDKK